jgi:hypothetical protein
MTAPPGFVHYTPCTLSLCPLRQDLVKFKQTGMRKQEKSSTQLGGQLDGSALSCLSHNTPIEVMSSDDGSSGTFEDAHNGRDKSGQDTMASLMDTNSRALNGSYSDSSDSGNDDDGEEAALEVTAEPQETVPEPQELKDRANFSPSSDSMDYFDVSEFASPPPSSDTDETPLLSLSHSGTLCKRERSTSPDAQNNSNKRSRRELTPDLDGFASILKRDRPTNLWDQKPLQQSDYYGSAVSPDPPLQKFESITPEHLFTHNFPSALLDSHSFTPTGPRALSNKKLVCFYWYHKGHCTPKRKRGRPVPCKYEHDLNMPHPQVSLPPVVTDHNPNCPLPLCPARVSETKPHDVNMRVRRTPERFIKDEVSTPPRRRAVDTRYSSSPRDGISEARRFVKGPKFNGARSFQQLPKLTGANWVRFKNQKRGVEQWQADNGVRPFDMDRKLAEEKKQKRIKKDRNKENRLAKETREGPVLNYGDETLRKPIQDAVAGADRQRSKNIKEIELIRDASGPFKADAVKQGSIETFVSRAKQYKSSFRPTGGFPEYTPMQNSREEIEDGPQHNKNTADMVSSLKDGSKPSGQRPLSMGSFPIDKIEPPKSMVNMDERTGQKNQVNRKSRVVVGYELPRGDARLDWDTDRVRRLFGEIE